MKSQLPQTGTEDFLELLSPFVPDDYLDQRWPRLKTGGRRYGFSASQLLRLHLLALITPVHSFNLLIRMLPEQKAWRRFAHIPSQEHVPGCADDEQFPGGDWRGRFTSSQRTVAGADHCPR